MGTTRGFGRKVTIKTVCKWRDRFRQHGMAGLNDLPRTGSPPKFRVEQRCEVIAIACDRPENYGTEGYTKWTVDTITEAANAHIENLNMSRTSIFRTLSEVDMKPHKTNMWLNSTDPQFKEKGKMTLFLFTMNRRRMPLFYASTKRPGCRRPKGNMRQGTPCPENPADMNTITSATAPSRSLPLLIPKPVK